MTPSPIRPDWIIDGDPQASSELLASSGEQKTYLWRCSPGSFRWHYSVDELVYFTSGSVSLVNILGDCTVLCTLGAGDHKYFRRGECWFWHVHEEVTKFAVCLTVPPSYVRAFLQFRRAVGQLVRPARAAL